jgi:hypothetical protein
MTGGDSLSVNKHLESQSSATPAKDAVSPGESSALVQFSIHLHSEPQKAYTEASKTTDQNKLSPERLFLGRVGQISLSAETDAFKTTGQAKVAWNKLFQPECFNEKAEPAQEDILCWKNNIYG